jgi:hypothetical protein
MAGLVLIPYTPNCDDFAALVAKALGGKECDHTLRYSRELLDGMDWIDADASLALFAAHSAFCDCAIAALGS